MFDFEGLVPVGQKLLYKGGVKAIFSKYYQDKEFLKKNSPKTHLKEGVKFPKLMLLYSKGDVFIEQSNLLKERLDSLKFDYQLYFEENEKAIHVFHHYDISSDMSKKANDAIIEFTKD